MSSIINLLNDPTLTYVEWFALFNYFSYFNLIPMEPKEVIVKEAYFAKLPCSPNKAQRDWSVQVDNKKHEKLQPPKPIKTKWVPEKFKTAQKKQERQRQRDYKMLH